MWIYHYLDKIRSNMFSTKLVDDIEDLKKQISETYSNMIHIYGTKIYLNDNNIEINKSFFDHNNCKIFNRKAYLYKLQNKNNEIKYYLKNLYTDVIKEFSNNTKILGRLVMKK